MKTHFALAALAVLAAASCATLAANAAPQGARAPQQDPAPAATERAPKPPHIVLFLADDLGWNDVSFHGSDIRTPNIDRLAAAGTRLEQFYVQPVCSPTRAALMTGRYPIRTGLQVGVIRPWADYGLPLDELLLPQLLRRAGYATAICGKWHLGLHERAFLPTQRGFDHQYGHYVGALDYFTHRRNGGVDWSRDDRPLDEEGYTTELIAAECVRLIEAHDPQKRPLFLYVPFNAPHTPLQAPERYLEMYRDKDIEKPQRRRFAAMVTCVDDAIGAVLEALERRGMSDDTLVMFTSDNGGPRGRNSGADNAPLRAGKGTLYEGGVRVPCVLRWPREVDAGVVVDEPLHVVDVLPTLVALAGGTTDGTRPLDGKDAWATIARGAASPHDDILLNVNDAGGAIRAGDHKLVVTRGNQRGNQRGNRPANQRRNQRDDQPGDQRARRRQNRAPKVELFDLSKDPGEKNDLASSHPERVAELQARLDGYAKAAVPARGGQARQPADFVVPRRWGHRSDERDGGGK